MHTPLTRMVVAAAVFAAGAVAGPARADIRYWTVVEVTPGQPSAHDRRPSPRVKVRVVGRPALAETDPARWQLREVGSQLGPVAAVARIPYHLSSETLAVVVLVEGHELFIGNDQYLVEDQPGRRRAPAAPPRTAGFHDALCRVLDAPPPGPGEVARSITHAGSPGSKGMLIVYGDTVEVRAPMGPLDQLSCTMLGGQELQRGTTGRHLIDGLHEAHARLKRTSADRKVVVVIGDGVDPGELAAVRTVQEQIENDRIDVLAFHAETDPAVMPIDDRARQQAAAVMKLLGGGARSSYWRVHDPADLSQRIASAVSNEIADRFYLVFPGRARDPRTDQPTGLSWDGTSHDVELLFDGEPLDERTWAVGKLEGFPAPPEPPAGWRWPLVAAGAGLLIGGLVLLVLLRRRATAAAA